MLALLCSRDLQSTLGRNRRLLEDTTGLVMFEARSKQVEMILSEREVVEVPNTDQWRLPYLARLLEQRPLHFYRRRRGR